MKFDCLWFPRPKPKYCLMKTHTRCARVVLQCVALVLLCCVPTTTTGQTDVSMTPRVVFIHDETNRIGNIYDMVELEGGAVALAGNSGVVILDSSYNVTAKQQLGGSLHNVNFVRLAEGFGIAGFSRKRLSQEKAIPHLLILRPDFEDLTEIQLCSTCSILGTADFDGNGVDSVVAWGDNFITVVDLNDSSEQEISMLHFDSRLRNLYGSTVVDINCDGLEELLFRSKVGSVLEHQNEWAVSKHFLLHFDKHLKLEEYGSFLAENWKTVRNCVATRVSKDMTGTARYLEGQQVQISPGNIGRHKTDVPVQNFLHLFNISGAIDQSWEVRMTGMRRALNFYPLVDTDCLNKNENNDDARIECSRYLSVYARWGSGCEQFFWESDDCGSWVLLLGPNGTWEQVATWPNWSFASLLTSDGRLLIHSVADLLEIQLPTNLVRPDE